MSACFELIKQSKKQKEEIAECVGDAYSIYELMQRPPVRSGNLLIHEMHVHGLVFQADHSALQHCNIEMRKKGIEVTFRMGETLYAWCIPYYQLSVFQSTYLTIHANGFFIRLKHAYTAQRSFFQRMLDAKNTFMGYS